MPVPVYLLFAASLLGEEGVSFTKGRLADGTEVGDTAEFLRSIAFGDVYHDSGVGRLGESSGRSDILNARHSEVVVENELALDTLRHIVCRSAAERETLLNLLSPQAKNRWPRRIHVDEGHRRMFEKRGTFVQTADLSSDKSRFRFYPDIEASMQGPFDLAIEWSSGDRTAGARQEDFMVSSRPVTYRLRQAASRYKVRITLDDNLAYLGTFDEQYKSDLLF